MIWRTTLFSQPCITYILSEREGEACYGDTDVSQKKVANLDIFEMDLIGGRNITMKGTLFSIQSNKGTSHVAVYSSKVYLKRYINQSVSKPI
jgi:hypothetical protein